MTIVRLIADDLTGALDTAAEFVAVAGDIAVYAARHIPFGLRSSFALDSGTREQTCATAVATLEGLASHLNGSDIAYKKVDSLLRGHTMSELAACWRQGNWSRCIVAPAFPFQRRITRNGMQMRQVANGDWIQVASILDLLSEAGLEARLARASDPIANGITICDAETDTDLSRIVDRARSRAGQVLWCGSAGLAQALVGNPRSSSMTIEAPVLGLFGSDQEITKKQLAACGESWLQLEGTGANAFMRLHQELDRNGVAMASFAMPNILTRPEAAQHISKAIEMIVAQTPKPSTLLAAGGETLRAICDATGATHLAVRGQFEPGLPHSMIRGGIWDGVQVVSKSGAFGGDQLWCDLLKAHGFTSRGALR